MRCPQCEAWVTPDLAVCPECGARLKDDSAAHGAAGGSRLERHRRRVTSDEARRRAEWEAAARKWSADSSEEGAAAAPEDPLAGRRGLGLGPGNAQPMPELERAAAEQVELEAEVLGILNPLLLHAGFSPLRTVSVRSSSPDGLAGMRLRVAAAPAVLEPLTVPLGDLGRGGELAPPAVAPDMAAFSALDEALRGQLELAVLYEDTVVTARSLPVTVQTANEWIALEGVEPALACAVTPNSEAVDGFAASMAGDFVAYQAGDRHRVLQEIQVIYDAIGALDLGYIGVPPSFEKTGQKILFPDEVLEQRRGCCIDIAVLTASLAERVGYNPVIAVVPGHAFCGVWTEEIEARAPVVRDGGAIRSAAVGGELVVWNSTTYFDREGDAGFGAAREMGENLLSQVEYIIDVASCRSHGFKPIPRSVRS